MSPSSREKRWRDTGGQRPPRSWQGGSAPHRGGGGGAPVTTSVPPSSQRSGHLARPAPPRSRPAYQSQAPPLHQQSQYRNGDTGPPQRSQTDSSERERSSRVVRGTGPRGGAPDAPPLGQRSSGEAVDPAASGRRPQQPTERPGMGSSLPTAPESQPSHALGQVSSANREASPPAERPVERKSYALARRTRSRPADLGSKQPSVEETPVGGGAGGKSWTGPPAPPEGGEGGGGSAVPSELDRDVARLSLGAGAQSWSQGPASYIRSEMRGGSHDWSHAYCLIYNVS